MISSQMRHQQNSSVLPLSENELTRVGGWRTCMATNQILQLRNQIFLLAHKWSLNVLFCFCKLSPKRIDVSYSVRSDRIQACSSTADLTDRAVVSVPTTQRSFIHSAISMLMVVGLDSLPNLKTKFKKKNVTSD